MTIPAPSNTALATVNFTKSACGFGYFDSSLITIQMAAAVPKTPPRRVPRGNS